MVELASDARLRSDHTLAINRRGILNVARWMGSQDGGVFEIPSVGVILFAPDGRFRRIHSYSLDQLDAARACFAALTSEPPPLRIENAATRSLQIPPNTASRTVDRLHEAREAGDWDALGALCAPALALDDRRRSILLTGDRDMVIATSRFAASQGVRATRTLLSTAGDRLALEHLLYWAGAADAPDLEVEALIITEIDSEGRVIATIAFDPDDRRAASAEFFERYVQSGADGMPRGVIEFLRGLNDHDLVRARTGLCDDFVFDDHRHVGLGRLEGGDAYIASIAAAFELTRDLRVDVLYAVAMAKHGRVVVARAAGANTEGGDFETLYAALVLFRGEQIAGIEAFEPEDLVAALARFEDLRRDPTRIPPNAATRAGDRFAEDLVGHRR